MRREIAVLTLGAGLALLGLSDYGVNPVQPSSAMERVLEVMAQKPAEAPPAKTWYNCRTREVWSADKQAWCKKAEKLKNARYQLPEFGTFQLKHGIYKNPDKQLDVRLLDKQDLIAFGDLNRNQTEDAAALLAVNSGGSGVFIYLVTLVDAGNNSTNQASALLGDRVKVQSITINSDRLKVDMITHAPNDPLCCPTKPATQLYALNGNKLEQIRKPAMQNRRSQLKLYSSICG